METIAIRVDDIETGERHRALSADAVQRLAKSMGEIGLKQPISVRVVDEMEVEGEMVCGVPLLVAGAHRLAAAKALGWSHIDCIEIEDDPIAAELWEIAENLHRCDLSAAERREHVRRYTQLLRAKAGLIDPKKLEQSRKVGRPVSIFTHVANDLGVSHEYVRLANREKTSEPPPAQTEDDLRDSRRKRAMNMWKSLTDEDRAWFRDWIDEPIMDRRYA